MTGASAAGMVLCQKAGLIAVVQHVAPRLVSYLIYLSRCYLNYWSGPERRHWSHVPSGMPPWAAVRVRDRLRVLWRVGKGFNFETHARGFETALVLVQCRRPESCIICFAPHTPIRID